MVWSQIGCLLNRGWLLMAPRGIVHLWWFVSFNHFTVSSRWNSMSVCCVVPSPILPAKSFSCCGYDTCRPVDCPANCVSKSGAVITRRMEKDRVCVLCISCLITLPAESVRCCFTAYSLTWYNRFLSLSAKLTKTWRSSKRIPAR